MGSAIIDVLIGVMTIAFVALPAFSFITDKYTASLKAQIISDAVDISGNAVYNSIITDAASEGILLLDQDRAFGIFKEILMKNLRLDYNLIPLDGSIVSGQVEIESFVFYQNNEELPEICPEGNLITRNAFHFVVRIPIEPSLFRGGFFGSEQVREGIFRIHKDIEMPVDN